MTMTLLIAFAGLAQERSDVREHAAALERPRTQPPLTGADHLKKMLGVQIESVRSTAGGRMLDLRYRVIHPESAKEILRSNSKIEVQIIDVKTGQTLRVPETHLGKLRTKSPKPKPNRIYYVLFDNPASLVKPGSEISIRFGPIQVDGWTVE